MAAGERHGYHFELSGCAPGPDGKAVSVYKVAAYPVTPNQTGVRAFCSDDSGVIKVDGSGSAQGCIESGQPLQ